MSFSGSTRSRYAPMNLVRSLVFLMSDEEPNPHDPMRSLVVCSVKYPYGDHSLPKRTDPPSKLYSTKALLRLTPPVLSPISVFADSFPYLKFPPNLLIEESHCEYSVSPPVVGKSSESCFTSMKRKTFMYGLNSVAGLAFSAPASWLNTAPAEKRKKDASSAVSILEFFFI